MEILLFLLTFLVTLVLTPKTLLMLKTGGLIRNNFRGDVIPISAGIIFTASLAITYSISALIFKMKIDAYVYLGFLSIISLTGLVDDVVGNRKYSGFKGHFLSLIKKREITTGLWKAALGGIIAIMAATYTSKSTIDLTVNVLLVALTTNLLNLFDVRPGRSIKVFFFATILVLILSPSNGSKIILIPLMGSVVAYSIYDISGLAMMGDAGSNVLGMALGLALIEGEAFYIKLILLGLLIVLHVISEYSSFTDIIEKNSFLRLIDQWGRRD